MDGADAGKTAQNSPTVVKFDLKMRGIITVELYENIRDLLPCSSPQCHRQAVEDACIFGNRLDCFVHHFNGSGISFDKRGGRGKRQAEILKPSNDQALFSLDAPQLHANGADDAERAFCTQE
ncbi:hypothetical protein D3C80_720700 [compost metagenome]